VRDTGSSGDVSDRGTTDDVSVNGHSRYLTADKAIWDVTAHKTVTSHSKDVQKGGTQTETEIDSYEVSEKERASNVS
jgi:hypothetical protein